MKKIVLVFHRPRLMGESGLFSNVIAEQGCIIDILGQFQSLRQYSKPARIRRFVDVDVSFLTNRSFLSFSYPNQLSSLKVQRKQTRSMSRNKRES